MHSAEIVFALTFTPTLQSGSRLSSLSRSFSRLSFTSVRRGHSKYLNALIGASVSEPPSSDTNGTFFYIIIYICVVRRAAYPKLIQFNVRTVYKIRIVQTPRVLQWSRTAILQQESPSHQRIEKTDCSVEESERESSSCL